MAGLSNIGSPALGENEGHLRGGGENAPAAALPSASCKLPFRQPSRKAAAVALAAMPCRGDLAIIGDHDHRVESPGTAQGFDRLLRGLRDRPRDIARCSDGHL